MAGLTPAGKLYTLVRRESLSSSESVVFLKHLLVQTGKKLLVIWNGSRLVAPLRKTLDFCRKSLAEVGHRFDYTIYIDDFILANPRKSFFTDGKDGTFHLVILNPSYYKVRKASSQAKAMEPVVHGHGPRVLQQPDTDLERQSPPFSGRDLGVRFRVDRRATRSSGLQFSLDRTLTRSILIAVRFWTAKAVRFVPRNQSAPRRATRPPLAHSVSRTYPMAWLGRIPLVVRQRFSCHRRCRQSPCHHRRSLPRSSRRRSPGLSGCR